MATIEETSKIPGIGAGILMPQLQYRFALDFFTVSNDDRDILRKQVLSCSINMQKRTVDIVFEQPETSMYLHSAIMYLCDNMIDIRVGTERGDATIISGLRLQSCKCISHEFKLDYAESETAKHFLTFEFNTMFEEEPKTK